MPSSSHKFRSNFQTYNATQMLKHYWLTSIRNLSRNKLFTAINVLGLSISVAIFLALTSYVRYQFSFDKFYEGGDKIFRVDYFEYKDGQPVLQSSRTHDRTALLIHEYVPQVEAVTRFINEKAYVFTEDVKIVDQDILFADSSFTKVFPLEMVSGDASKALIPPFTVMISQSQAHVYFGNTDPVGKVIYLNEHLAYTITGVFRDIPDQASVKFDFLLSWSTMIFNKWVSMDGTFDAPWTFTFVRMKKHIEELEPVNKRLTDMAKEHITSLQKRGHTAEYRLKPYEDLHTSADLSGEVSPGTNKALLYALILLAVFILIAAWINYVNLSLAKSLERAGEIGVRKVFGASRFAISGQFLMEAFIVASTTFLFGYGLYEMFTGPLSGILFTHLQFLETDFVSLVSFIFAFILVTAGVAFYPAHFLSRYKPVMILKNKLGSGKGKANFLFQSLMIFQLFLAVAIVGITLIAQRQVKFMQNFNSGFDAKHALTLRAPATTCSDSLRYTRYMAFRSEVLQHPAFKAGTASMNVPGQEIRFHDEGINALGMENEKKQSFWEMGIDDGYQETFGMELIAGRNFNEKEFGTTCLINESAAKALGYTSPSDAVNTKIINSAQNTLTIIGVWKDYHHQSIRKSVDPIIFYHRHPFEYGYYSFNIQSRQGDYLKTLETIFQKHYPDDQFVYYFMEDFFIQQYQADELFGSLLNLFSVISIFVASLGLFGMASLAIVKRTKEIGVRKVLGATTGNIVVMLSKSYVKLIAISCLFAFPAAYYLTSIWLDGFAYKINIAWWMILSPGLIVLIVTLLTISLQSIRAAVANPMESLRDQ